MPYDLQLSGLYFYGSGQRFTTTYGAGVRDSGNAFSRLRPNGTIMPRNDLAGQSMYRSASFFSYVSGRPARSLRCRRKSNILDRPQVRLDPRRDRR